MSGKGNFRQVPHRGAVTISIDVEVASRLSDAARRKILAASELLATLANAPGQARAEHPRADELTSFLSDACVIDSNWSERASDLHAAYCAWCAGRSQPPMTMTAFGRGLAALGYARRKNVVIFWLGLRLPQEQRRPGVVA